MFKCERGIKTHSHDRNHKQTTHTHTHTHIHTYYISASTHLGFHTRTLPNSSVPKTGGWGKWRLIIKEGASILSVWHCREDFPIDKDCYRNMKKRATAESAFTSGSAFGTVW